MHWYLFALLSPLLWAISVHIDKYVLGRYLKNANSSIIAIFAGLVGLLFSIGIFIFAHDNLLDIGLYNGVLIVFNGALLIIAFIPYYFALNEDDSSLVVPLFQTIPIFTFGLGFVLLGETISSMQIIAGILIIFGSVLISLNLENKKVAFRWKMIFLMLLSSLLISIHYLIFKIVAIQGSFWTTVFWEYLGATLVAIFILIFFGKYRRQFVSVIKENSFAVITINTVNEIINIAAKVMSNYATMFIPVVVVNLANGLQPMFVFVIGLIITIFFPFIAKEQISRNHILQRVIAIVILFVGTYLLIV